MKVPTALRLISLLILMAFGRAGVSQTSNASGNRPVSEDNKKQAGPDVTNMKVPDAIGGPGDAESKAAVDEATIQLEGMCSVNGDLWTLCSKHDVKGEFVVDLTIQGKGKVVTVFMVSSTGSIDSQIVLKNKLMDCQFLNIKLPKNKRIKFRYTLNLNC